MALRATVLASLARSAIDTSLSETLWELRATLCALDCLLCFLCFGPERRTWAGKSTSATRTKCGHPAQRHTHLRVAVDSFNVGRRLRHPGGGARHPAADREAAFPGSGQGGDGVDRRSSGDWLERREFRHPSPGCRDHAEPACEGPIVRYGERARRRLLSSAVPRGTGARLVCAAAVHRRARVEDAIARVALRVSKGGHAVPEADIRRRWPRTHENLAWFARHADAVDVFANAARGVPPVLVARVRAGHVELLDLDAPPAVTAVLRSLS